MVTAIPGCALLFLGDILFHWSLGILMEKLEIL